MRMDLELLILMVRVRVVKSSFMFIYFRVYGNDDRLIYGRNSSNQKPENKIAPKIRIHFNRLFLQFYFYLDIKYDKNKFPDNICLFFIHFLGDREI